ncbi:unnamed protein product, partial [Mesorhabditis spiculigera]
MSSNPSKLQLKRERRQANRARLDEQQRAAREEQIERTSAIFWNSLAGEEQRRELRASLIPKIFGAPTEQRPLTIDDLQSPFQQKPK